MAIGIDVGSKWLLIGRRKPITNPRSQKLDWNVSSYNQRWILHKAIQVLPLHPCNFACCCAACTSRSADTACPGHRSNDTLHSAAAPCARYHVCSSAEGLQNSHRVLRACSCPDQLQVHHADNEVRACRLQHVELPARLVLACALFCLLAPSCLANHSQRLDVKWPSTLDCLLSVAEHQARVRRAQHAAGQ